MLWSSGGEILYIHRPWSSLISIRFPQGPHLLMAPHQHGPGEVLARVDAPVLADEAVERGPDLDVGVVQHGVEHDDGEAEDVALQQI